MVKQELPGGRIFIVEPGDKKLRLILSDGKQELACRKETRAKLKRFISSAETSLFKGRLQFMREGEAILIVMKGKVNGAISTADFERMLG